MFKQGDLVRVMTGEHKGRKGKVIVRAGDIPIYDVLMKLEAGQIVVALDGEDGQTAAEGGRGGRGGVTLPFAAADIEIFPPARDPGHRGGGFGDMNGQ